MEQQAMITPLIDVDIDDERWEYAVQQLIHSTHASQRDHVYKLIMSQHERSEGLRRVAMLD